MSYGLETLLNQRGNLNKSRGCVFSPTTPYKVVGENTQPWHPMFWKIFKQLIVSHVDKKVSITPAK